jgi:uncharacterized protein (DUF1499 family)
MNDIASIILPCPSSPNCVSTLATDSQHRIDPIRYVDPTDEAVRRITAILRSMPRVRITSAGDGVIRAEFTTLIFRFVDDVVFAFDDETKTIHFRSASRVGRGDLGVNRRRMESIRRAFAKG